MAGAPLAPFARAAHIPLATAPAAEVYNTIQHAPVFPWSDTGLIKSMTNVRIVYDDVGFTPAGKIRFSYYTTFWGIGLKHGPFTLDPGQIIGVKFFVDEEHEGAGAGETRYLPAINLLDLSPEGTIRRYFVDTTWPPIVLPDGSLIVEHDAGLVRLTLPA